MPENLFKRGHQFVFRRSVPESIRSILGKREVKAALGTDYRLACREAAILTVQTNEQFEQARRQLSRVADDQDGLARYLTTPSAKRKFKTISKVSPELPGQIASLWLGSLQNDLDQRKQGLSDDDYDHMESNIQEMRPLIDRALATGQVEPFMNILPMLVHGRGYHLNISDEALRALTYESLKSIQQFYAVLAERQKGNLVAPRVESAPLPAVWEPQKSTKNSAHGGPTWDELLERWERDRDRTDTNTVYEMKPIWKSLASFAGKTPPAQFSKRMVTDWLKSLRDKLGNQPKTLEKKGALAGAVFSLAVKDELISSNPFAGYSYKRLEAKTGSVSQTERYPFTVEDLRVIFHPQTGLVASGVWGGGGLAARQWIPLIALFSGARLDEIGGLRKSDFGSTPVPYFKISRAKNKSSIREIPLHPKLIELGLMDYVASCTTEFIFDGLRKVGASTVNSETLGKWFNLQIKKRLLPGSQGKVFHSFRHTFKDLCRNSRIPKDLHQALTGHSSGDVGDSYGLGFSLEVKAVELARIQLPIELHQPPRKAI